MPRQRGKALILLYPVFNNRKRAISAFLSAMQDAQALLFMKVKGKQ
jgi:hypothetical protein